MLSQVAEGVLVHTSSFCRSNAVVVEGPAGALLVDPGILGDELICLADDLLEREQPVAVGFATHPHWDHLLWHPRLGSAPRWGTDACAAAVRGLLATPQWQDRVASVMPADLVGRVPLALFGEIAGLGEGADAVPWDGPRVRVLEHRAHAAGHAALLVEECGVLIAGDLLSDVLVPMLDHRAEDPIGDSLDALQRIEDLADRVVAVVPGHGGVGSAAALRDRVALDRAYLHALRDGVEPDDPRIGPSAEEGWGWVRDVHEHQRQALALRG